ncbi:MAG: cyclopropane-fatty-acyl-phospholipid synthase family protein [Haloarculaceae archaeon]
MDGQDVEAHYDRRSDLTESLLAALRDAGRDPDDLSRGDLDGVAEFHVRGRAVTRELARLADLDAGERVLDVGCGLGGPARTLAAEYGCRAVGLDRTGAFLRAARELTARVGLADEVTFVRGDALAPPVADGAFDAAFLQHVGPNVPDEARLLDACAAALRPGGRLAVYEIFAGDGDLHYPVPFASDPGEARLSTPETFAERAAAAGFERLTWTDDTAACLDWYESMDGPPAVGLGVVMGEEFPAMGRNVRRNLAEGRAAVWRGVFERRA